MDGRSNAARERHSPEGSGVPATTNDSTSKPMVDAFEGMHLVWKLFFLVAVVLAPGLAVLFTA